MDSIPTWAKRPLSNITCIYCGQLFDDSSKTKEHVVGRRFVPRGTLAGSWNLIANACERCNREKSALEDDISAITMQPTPFGDFPTDDSALHAEANRKATATSQRTGKPVGESQESVTIKTPFLGGIASFGAVCPPQIDRERAYQLAYAHVRAFFYFITYDVKSNRGEFCIGEFSPIEITACGDWGSPLNRSFMSIVALWDHRVVFAGAQHYFKIAIRRHPSAECWSWAVEWNQNYRVIGLMGDPVTIPVLRASLTPNPTTSFSNGTETFRFRPNVSLPASDDTLFQLPPPSKGSPIP